MSIDSLVDALENNKYADLKSDFNDIIKSKIDTKIEEKKVEILNVINGVKENSDEENNTDNKEGDENIDNESSED